MRYFRAAFNLVYTYYPYLLKPAVWPAIWRMEIAERVSRLFGKQKPSRTADAAVDWCAHLAISTEDALAELNVAVANPETIYPEVFDQAKQAEGNCPIKMGGAGNLTLLYSLVEGLNATRGIETGVAYGWSSLATLLSLQKRQGQLFSVDLPYFKLRSDNWVGCVVPSGLRGNWQIYRCADREGLPQATRAAGSIDFAHYDSDKSVPGRLWGYDVLWNALRSGGLVVSDDIGDNDGFQQFCEKIGIAPIVVVDQGKYQGILRKP
ncbi:class I SAM-dependent methyltransferase [Pelagibius sp. Alg239-R121]|uniref:class I SAM-dependent methyltransferase n=1 Tax=Pelagibius sp. Alg239-R121 TaxID=2993448 RepID=UPI0024A6D3AA|nr:class I SAM-dependent methyltransferase [Pelagibius sp. Alg239-R121]